MRAWLAPVGATDSSRWRELTDTGKFRIATPVGVTEAVVSSFPDEPFIVLDLVSFKKCEEFFFESSSAMVLFLSVNVSADSIHIRPAHAEPSVAFLPCKRLGSLEIGLHP